MQVHGLCIGNKLVSEIHASFYKQDLWDRIHVWPVSTVTYYHIYLGFIFLHPPGLHKYLHKHSITALNTSK